MKHCAVVFLALFFCASLAGAQSVNKPNIFSSTLAGGIHLRAIAGAPFSADVVKESTTTLPDGRQAPVVTRGRMFRDAAGRTRSETELLSSATAEPRRFATIVDPEQQRSIVLDTQAKTAMIFSLPAANTAETQATAEAAAADRVPAKALAMRGAEELGASMIEGFRVTGTRVIRLAEQSENMVMESWFSPELKIELEARIAGPRLGETITRLENIAVVDPDPALFEVPADYTVKLAPPAK